MRDPIAWLDGLFAEIENNERGKPDCFIVEQRQSSEPIAVFKTKKALYAKFPAIVKRYSVSAVWYWWFDDKEEF